MAAPKGNQFWKMRSSHGRSPIFKTPEDLWNAACEYFEWVSENPLEKAELVKYQGVATLESVPVMRAMTIGGMCIYLDIDFTTWRDYQSKGKDDGDEKDFSKVATRIESIIKTQKFEGAAAELLNPNIIARDLGLADKQEISASVSPVVELPANGKRAK